MAEDTCGLAMSKEAGHFQMPLPTEGTEATDVWLKPLAADAFETLLQKGLLSMDGTEGEEMAALHAWFIRRYPTPTERLDYIRRKTREIARK
jgi:hypothetical protein